MLQENLQSKPFASRGPRRALIVTAVTAVLAAGGAGVAYATSNGGQSVETGFVVDNADGVDGAKGAVGRTDQGTGAAAASGDDCDKWTQGTGPSELPSQSPPAATDSPSVAGEDL